MRVGQVELPHLVEISVAEAAPAAAGEVGRHLGDKLLAVAGAALPLLLVLDDAAADFPIGRRPDCVNGAGGNAAGRVQQFNNLGQDGLVVGVGWCRHGAGRNAFFRHVLLYYGRCADASALVGGDREEVIAGQATCQ